MVWTLYKQIKKRPGLTISWRVLDRTSFGLNWRPGRDSPNKKSEKCLPLPPCPGKMQSQSICKTFVTYHKRWDIPTIHYAEKAIGFVVSQQEKRTSFYIRKQLEVAGIKTYIEVIIWCGIATCSAVNSH